MTEKEKKPKAVVLTTNTPIQEKRMKKFITTANLDSPGKLIREKDHGQTK